VWRPPIRPSLSSFEALYFHPRQPPCCRPAAASHGPDSRFGKVQGLTERPPQSCRPVPQYHKCVTAKAWLEGHQFDLDDLAELLATGDVRVVREDDAYYLTAPEIDNPPEAGRFDKPAERLMGNINGLGRVRSADFRPVKLSGKYTDSNGNEHLIVSPAPAELRLRMSAAGVVLGPHGKPMPEPPSPWPSRLALAETNPEVAEALELMSRADQRGLVGVTDVSCSLVRQTGCHRNPPFSRD